MDAPNAQSPREILDELKLVLAMNAQALKACPAQFKLHFAEEVLQAIESLQKSPIITKEIVDLISQNLQLAANHGHEEAKILFEQNAAREKAFQSESATAFSENNLEKIRALCENYPQQLYLHLENAPRTEHHAEIYFTLGKCFLNKNSNSFKFATGIYCYFLAVREGHTKAQEFIKLKINPIGKILSTDFLPIEQREICESYLQEVGMNIEPSQDNSSLEESFFGAANVKLFFNSSKTMGAGNYIELQDVTEDTNKGPTPPGNKG